MKCSKCNKLATWMVATEWKDMFLASNPVVTEWEFRCNNHGKDKTPNKKRKISDMIKRRD